MSEPCWYHVGTMLEPCWYHVGTMLEPCLNHVGDMLKTCWNHVGTMLVPCWNHVGTMLEPCWNLKRNKPLVNFPSYKELTLGTRFNNYTNYWSSLRIRVVKTFFENVHYDKVFDKIDEYNYDISEKKN